MTQRATARSAEKSLSSIAGQAVLAGLLLNGLAIALAFIAYRFDYGVSSVPGKISVAIAVICIAVPVLCWLACASTRKFAMHGSVRLIGLLSAYALIGVAFYFFYFFFAPMPVFERVLGLGAGGALSAYWLISIAAFHGAQIPQAGADCSRCAVLAPCATRLVAHGSFI